MAAISFSIASSLTIAQTLTVSSLASSILRVDANGVVSTTSLTNLSLTAGVLSVSSTLTSINSITSAALSNLTLGTGSFGTALTLTSATGAATFAGAVTLSASPLTLRSGASGTLTYISIGRTSDEARVTVAAATNDGVTGSAAGDLIVGSNANVWLGVAGSSVGKFTSATVTLPQTTASSSASTGALVVGGGVGIAGATYIGGVLNVAGSSNAITIATTGAWLQGPAGGNLIFAATSGNSVQINANGGTLVATHSSAAVTISPSTASTSTTTGSLINAGGFGNAGALYNGGIISTANNIYFTGSQSLAAAGSIGVQAAGGLSLWAKTGSLYDFVLYNAAGTVLANIATGTSSLTVATTTASTSTTTGSLINAGGFGNAGAAFIGANSTLAVASGPTWTLKRNGDTAANGAINFTGSDDIVDWQVGTNRVIGTGFEINQAGTNQFYMSLTGAITLGSASSITAASATNLTLAGGSSGASLVLGQGANGKVLAQSKGNGYFAVNEAGTNSNVFQTYLYGANGTAFVAAGANATQGFIGAYITSGGAAAPLVLQSAGSNVLIGGTTDISGSGGLKVFGTTAATSTTSGSLQNAGGFGNAGTFYNGGNIFITANTGSNRYVALDGVASLTGTLIVQAGGGSSQFGGSTIHYSASHASKPGWVSAGLGSASAGRKFTVHSDGVGTGTDVFTVDASGNTVISATTASTSTTTGALTVAGGVGVAGAIYTGGIISIVDQTLTRTNSTTLTFNQGIATGGAMAAGGDLSCGGDLTVSGGNVGIGGALAASSNIRILGSTTSGTTQIGVDQQSVFTNGATTAGIGLRAILGTASSVFTMTDGIGFLAEAPSLGATSTVTTMTGVKVSNQGHAQVGTAYGIDIAAQSGSATNVGLRNAGLTILSNTGGTAAGGILFGADTTLYRSAAATLETDGGLIIGTNTIATPRLQLAGGYSRSAWTTNGTVLRVIASTATDTSSSGTVAAQVMSTFGAISMAASSSTTYTDAATVYIEGGVTAGANVTITNSWGLWNVGATRLDALVVKKAGQGWGVTNVTTAAGTTTLTTASTTVQVFVGSTTQTVQLPAANALGAGVGVVYAIVNRSSANVTVQRAGSDTINGSTTFVLTGGLNQSVHLVSNGVDTWVVL